MQKDIKYQAPQLAIYCLALTSIVFITNPIYTILIQKTIDIDFSFFSFLVSLFIFFIFALIIVLSIFFLFSKFFGVKKITNFVLILSIYISLCIINPITKQDAALMNGLNFEINYLFLIVNTLSTLGIFFLIKEKVKFQKIIFIFMALITIIIIIVTSKKLSTQEKPQDFNFQLGERNIIIFSFDGIPGITMNEFTSDPKFLDTFKDFILHKNTISHSPATYASTYHELFGAMDWKSVASTQLQLEKLSNEFMNSEQIWYLENAIRYGAYSEFGNQANKKLLIQNGAILLGKRNSLLAFVSVPIISSSFCKFGFCTLGEKYGNLANYIRKISLTTGNLSDRMRRSSNDYKAFEKIINSISKDNKVFGSFFGHFTFTHAPILQNENCVFLSSSLNQNEQLVRKQVMCVISLMNKIIYTLKENNLYEESLIVFKSDHGKPNTYFNKNNVRGKKIFNYDNPWGYDRYRPFVMYKNPNQKNKTLVQNEDLFYLSNLSQMYCKFYEFYNDLNIRNCSSIENFMKKNYPSIKTSKDLLYVPESSKTFMYDGHSVFHNKNSIHEMEKMFNSWSIENK